MYPLTAMRNPLFFCLSASILTLACLPAASPAQEPASNQPATTIKVQAREVILPVTVRDKKGSLVTSLKISDFTLTEDGRPQTIESFARETNLPFRLGLLVDTSRSVSGAMEEERKAAGKFVDTMLPEKPNAAPDQAFLIHFDHEVELLEEFTASRDKLHHELDEMGPSRRAQSDSQNPETSGNDNGGYGGRGQGQGQSHSGRGGTQLYDAIYLATDTSDLMKGQNGRKALVVFSDGVDRGSKMDLNDAVDAAEKANVTVYTIYFKGEQEHSEGGFPNGGGRHGGGGGYPGGGGGWPGGGGGGGGHHGGGGGASQPEVDGKKIMEKIATRTGGRYFEAKKKDNLEEIYGQIAEELRGQYLLTYTPDLVDREGGYHKIALKANKDDLTVVTREGYYAPIGEAK